MAINSRSNEEFLVKALEDQLKILCFVNWMISKVVFHGVFIKVKYYQNWMAAIEEHLS